MSGKWSQPGIPHKGWDCVGVEDLGSPDATCEMCETQAIRYVHSMHHPDYPAGLQVGCVCAEKMSGDYEGPQRREKALRSAAGRKKRWLSRAWKTSARGNTYLNTDGFNVTIFRRSDGRFGGRIAERSTNRSITSQQPYATEDAAKLAAFDGMIFLKDERGWGR
jgi:hypothetical protein